MIYLTKITTGGVAQMVERSLSMREVPGSIPGASKTFDPFTETGSHCYVTMIRELNQSERGRSSNGRALA